jgi:hypothetical protein
MIRTFNKNIVEVPKLLIPELKFSTLDMRDEATERQFMQELRGLGVPISDEGLMVGNFNWNSKDEYKKFNEELKAKTIAQQRAKFETYTALTIQGLPVPADLKAEVESVLQPQGQGAAQGLPMGGDQPPMPGGPPGGGAGGPEAGPGGIMMPNAPADLNPQSGEPRRSWWRSSGHCADYRSRRNRPGDFKRASSWAYIQHASAIDWKSMDDATRPVRMACRPIG